MGDVTADRDRQGVVDTRDLAGIDADPGCWVENDVHA